MRWLFDTASSFNQPLDKWDTSKVNYMSYMHVVFVERAAAS
jgi:surface protein